MNKLPKIVLLKNPKGELERFIRFLNHSYYPQHRNFILEAFPKLASELKKSKKEKETVKSFISDFYQKHENKIKKITEESETAIKNGGSDVLKMLAGLMSYKWKHPLVYKAMPTILPFSPFKNNTFYFSILGQIKRNDKNNILFISAHEISHFIFFDILKEAKVLLPEDLKNYLKESLTAFLLNQNPLRNFLNLQNYKGNQEIRDLFIEKPDGEIVKFVGFLEKFYRQNQKEKETFQTFLKKVINILIPAGSEFSKKRVIWNRYGYQIYKKPKILTEYQKPISV